MSNVVPFPSSNGKTYSPEELADGFAEVIGRIAVSMRQVGDTKEEYLLFLDSLEGVDRITALAMCKMLVSNLQRRKDLSNWRPDFERWDRPWD